jgi:rhodanese-related sulfurtransferase
LSCGTQDDRLIKDRDKGFVESSLHIPLQKLRDEIDTLDKEALMVTYCNKGVSGNAAQNVLINQGFKNVYNLSGGYKQYRVEMNK